MKRATTVAAFVIGLIAFTGSGQTRLGLFVDPPPAVSAAVMQALDEELRSIFEPTGLDIRRRGFGEANRGEVFERVVVLRFRGACDWRGLPPGSRGNSMGLTHVSGESVLPFIEIDCDRVLRTLRGGLDSYPAAWSYRQFASALARVAAHEIYHAVGQTREHTAAGITKAALSRGELLTPHMSLCEEAVELIRSRQTTQRDPQSGGG